jgi:sulfate permease, SulP family
MAAGESVGARGHPPSAVLGVLAGLVAGVVAVMVSVSFAVLIFGAPTPGQVGRGIALVLAATAVVAAVNALGSSFPGIIAGTQDNAAVVLAILAAGVAGAAPATLDEVAVFATVVVAIATGGLVTGLVLLLLGRFRLGRLVRYLPYPVIGGFLGGTGWLLLVGGLEVLLDRPLTPGDIAVLWEPALLARWLPATLAAAAVVWALRRSVTPMVFPLGLVAGVVVFFVVLAVTGTTPAEARAAGWLLGPFPPISWPPVSLGELATADLSLVVGQLPVVGSLLIITAVSLLLNSSGVEIATGHDVDLDRELRVSGLANLLAGAIGGTVGYTYTSVTVLVDRLGGARRLAGLIVAGLCITVLVVGFTIVAFVPVPIVGALLVLLGFAFLSDWLIDGRRALPASDYAVVVTIVIAIAVVGLLTGIGLGLVIAVGLYVVRSSRIAAVKHVMSGSSYRSNVERHPREQELLRVHGDRLLVLELQGFVFFGTAAGVVQEVDHRLAGGAQVGADYVILDLRRTTGLDSSAVYSFERLQRRSADRGWRLVVSGANEEIVALLRRGGLAIADHAAGTDPALTPSFVDLDHAVQWCEDRLLAAEGVPVAEGDRADPAEVLEIAGEVLWPCLESRTIPAGEILIRQGEVVEGLFVVTAGRVTAILERGEQPPLRLRSFRPGAVVGEIGLELGTCATATVRADTDVEVAVLTRAELARLERTAPATAAALHRSLARLLGRRLAAANRTIDAVLD